jgi:hypothetical protein
VHVAGAARRVQQRPAVGDRRLDEQQAARRRAADRAAHLAQDLDAVWVFLALLLLLLLLGVCVV